MTNHGSAPNIGRWLDTYIQELTTFPQAGHNDQVDLTSQALEWISVGKKTTGILDYYTELLETERQAGRIPR